jgi:hypothetical protein
MAPNPRTPKPQLDLQHHNVKRVDGENRDDDHPTHTIRNAHLRALLPTRKAVKTRPTVSATKHPRVQTVTEADQPMSSSSFTRTLSSLVVSSANCSAVTSRRLRSREAQANRNHGQIIGGDVAEPRVLDL